MPPDDEVRKRATVIDRCRAASLMNNLANLLIIPTPTQETLPQAQAWASKALTVVRLARAERGERSSEEQGECDSALATILFNMGMLSEVNFFFFPSLCIDSRLIGDVPDAFFPSWSDGIRSKPGQRFLPPIA